jgi:uncharacterized protein
LPPSLDRVRPFVPLFRNPHLQTVAGHYWPRPRGGAPVESRIFETEPGVRVLVESQRPMGKSAGDLVLVHGLEGSSQAGYMVGLANAAVRAGFTAHRLNLRNCGGGLGLCKTLYHAGLTADLLALLRELGAGPFYLAGFSLGGNVVLKLAGELGESASGWIGGVCAVSTPIDLAACVRRIGQRDNWMYERRFVLRMLARMKSMGRTGLEGIRTIFDVDDRITAPAFGFGNAENYYRTQSSRDFLAGIRVPTLLIQAKDDTFIPYDVFEHRAVRANPWVQLLACEHGGHLGFLGRRPHRFWLDEAIVDWFRAPPFTAETPGR